MIDNYVSMVSSWKPQNNEEALLKHEMLIHYICDQIPQTLSKYRAHDWNKGLPSENAPIWLCWLDGPNDMPEVVSRCIKSVCDHSSGHPVRFIDYNNIGKYVCMPERIAALRDEGALNLAHYCDVLRLMLLIEYGGLWVDADTFVSRDIPEDYFSNPFTTAKNDLIDIPYKEKLRYVGNGNWHVSIIGCHKGNSLAGFMRDAILEALSNNIELLSYFFLDYTFEIARRHFPQAASHLSTGAVYNGRHRKFNSALRKALPGCEYKSLLSTDCVFNVLNWKNEYPCFTANGEAAVYSVFLNNPKADPEFLLSLR